MKRIQKISWFIAITIIVAILVAATAVVVIYFTSGPEKAGAGVGFLGLAGLAGFAGVIFPKKDKVDCDERDMMIRRRAAIVGFAAAYLTLGLSTMIPFSVMGSRAMIEVTWLPLIFMFCGLMNFLCYSMSIIVQYGLGGRDDE